MTNDICVCVLSMKERVSSMTIFRNDGASVIEDEISSFVNKIIMAVPLKLKIY